MRKVYILPNLFTAGSLFFGMLAIFQMFEPEPNPVFAINLIFIAAILDTFDGMIARLTHTQSLFGLNLDSLADVVSFGVAPAVLVYASISEPYHLVAKATCGLYAVCGALRLARFNVQAQREEKKSFLGLPIPGAALVGLSIFWALHNHADAVGWITTAKVMPVVMVTLAYLMVSKFQYYGIKSLRLSQHLPFEILVSIVVVIALLMALKDHIDLIACGFFLLYMLSGPLLSLKRGRLGEALEGEGAGEALESRRLRRRFRRKPRRNEPPPIDPGIHDDPDSSAPKTFPR